MRFQATLDPSAETKRQFFTLVVWLFFLGTAVVVAAAFGTHVPGMVDPLAVDAESDATQVEIHRSRVARVKIALLIGLALPAMCTLLLARRHRRHGAHAQGISIELTETELRIWGRGYGSRVPIEGAELHERLVDVYAGRLGAWRQVRMKLKTKARELELAARAEERDLSRDLRLDGGEADSVEIDREDYEVLRAEIERRLRRPS